jgi:germacradienol/geosmin synthase
MGMLDELPGVPGGGVWDERRFLGFDLAHCAAMIHADAAPEQLELSADWLAWGTYGDDYFPVVFGNSRNLAAAKMCNDRLALFMPLDAGPTPEPTDPLERGLADLWRRTAGPMTSQARREFRTAVEDMTSSWLWELDNQARNRIPDPIDYVEMRRRTFGSDLTASLARLSNPGALPPEIFRTRVMHELDTAAQDYACFTNDLYSYQKEIEFEGEVHNLVLVLENFLDIDRWTARDHVARLMAARLGQFEHIAAHDLPVLVEEFALDDTARQALDRHVARLRDWMSGILEWHRRCVRYTDRELRRRAGPAAPALPGPTGLGTSAAELATRSWASSPRLPG